MTFRLLQVGSDTEFFLRDIKTKKPVPAIGLFGGTKKNPKPVFIEEPGFCIQEDNVMAEVNIPPSPTKEVFIFNCERILNWLREEAKQKGLRVEICSSMKFDPEQLKHPQARNIGCEPDYCVWTRKENQFDETKRMLLEYLRSTGGHLHVSFEHSRRKITQQDKELLVMFLDLFLGIPSIFMDDDEQRRKLYGKAGAFRFTPFGGIEYRVLSNFWWRSRNYLAWTFNQVQQAIMMMNEKASIRVMFDQAKDIQKAINERDFDLGNQIVEQWGMRIP